MRKIAAFRLTMILTLLAMAIPAVAQPQSAHHPRVVMILVDRITLQDITSNKLSSLRRLAAQGGIGLMNANVWGRRGPEAAYVSLGAGARAMGNAMAPQAYNSQEKLELEGLAGDTFRRMSGVRPGPESVVSLSPASLEKDNQKAMSMAIAGSLGQALHDSRLRTAAIGNSDDPEHLVRLGATVAMDESGLVDFGAVSSQMVKVDPSAPLGFRTNPAEVLAAYRRFAPKADFVVVDTGDMARVERARGETLEAIFDSVRDQSLARTDALLRSLLDQISLRDTLVMVITPCPPVPDGMWDVLPPVIMAGKGIRPGLLTSAGTHTPGLITLTDIAPTALSALGVAAPATMEGQVAFIRPHSDGITQLGPYSDWATLNYHVRIPIMIFCAVLVVLSISTAILALAFPKHMPRWLSPLSGRLLLATMAVPLAALIPPLVTVTDPIRYYLAWLISLVGITGISLLLGRKRPWGPPVALLMLTSAAILADTLAGEPLSGRSVIAACPITGIRYYGLGNEYMGALVGSLLISAAFIFGREQPTRGSRSVVLALLLALTAGAIGAPFVGANAGGALTAIPGFGLLFLLLLGYKAEKRQVALLLLSSIAVMGGFVLLDFLRDPQQRSHIGQVAAKMGQSGVVYAAQIAGRKIQMNLSLITGAAGTGVIVGLIPAFALWAYVLRERAITVMGERPWLRLSGKAAALSIPLALLFNDSGIVPAAIIAASVMTPWLWLMLEGESHANHGS